MADKIKRPPIEKIMEILDKNTSALDKNYAAGHKKAKHLAIEAKDFIAMKIEARKTFVFSTISSKIKLSPFYTEFILLLVEILPAKLSIVYVLDDIIDLLVNYTKIKSENDRIYHKLANLISLPCNEKGPKYSIEEIKSLMAEFVNYTNDKYLYKETDKLNFAIKYEYENIFAKKVEFYKEKLDEYKAKYNALLIKDKQIFPNKTFQSKIIRKWTEFSKTIGRLKQAIYYRKLGKAYGIGVRIQKLIRKNIKSIKLNYGLEDIFIDDKKKILDKNYKNETMDAIKLKLDADELNILNTLDQNSTEDVSKIVLSPKLKIENKINQIKEYLNDFRIKNNFMDENYEPNSNITIEKVKLEDLEHIKPP